MAKRETKESLQRRLAATELELEQIKARYDRMREALHLLNNLDPGPDDARVRVSTVWLLAREGLGL